MGRIRDLAEGLWSGELDPAEHHPFAPLMDLEPVAPRTAFVSSFANATAFETDAGLVLVDTGSFLLARQVHETIRGWSPRPLHTAVFTHGHVDHVFGVGPFDEESATKGWRRPHVVAHRDLPARFDRYRKTAGWNACINARQFRMPGLRWPTEYRYPDEVYHGTHGLDVGGLRLELVHARGETDDHTWLWIPERKVLCTGDLFIWATPNAGNPQKVQRYPHDWSLALRAMQTLDAELMLPGHGYPIRGAARIRQALGETAEVLEYLHDTTLDMMNAGASLEEIVHAVQPPKHLLERPYLQPVYDEPEFVVRNVWRLYGGWWDGNPAHLKPASESAIGAELARLAGGADRLAARALELAAKGELALACNLVELAARGAPSDAEIRKARAKIYRQRARAERSVMARGVFDAAAGPDKDDG